MIDLLNMDCMEYMAALPDGAFSLCVADPPYGLPKGSFQGSGKLKNRLLHKCHAKVSTWDVAPPEEYFKELFRVSKNQIIFGGNYFGLPPTRGIFCWDKVQPWQNFSQIEYGWTSFNVPAKLFRFDNRKGGKIHPCQKPVALYKWLLATYAKQGDTILDTHLGSGSIALACYELGFDLVGCEIDQGYFNGAVERLEKFKGQTLMDFVGGKQPGPDWPRRL